MSFQPLGSVIRHAHSCWLSAHDTSSRTRGCFMIRIVARLSAFRTFSPQRKQFQKKARHSDQRFTTAMAAAPAAANGPAVNGGAVQPSLSRRVRSTDNPIVVQTKKLMAGTPGCMSLAQGIVYW